MHHHAAGQGEGGLIRRSRTDAGERRRARQPGEFCRRDADRGDSRLRLGCLAARLMAASAESRCQHRSTGPGQGYPAGRRPPQAAGPGLPGGRLLRSLRRLRARAVALVDVIDDKRLELGGDSRTA